MERMTYDHVADHLMTAKEAGEYLRLSEGTVRNRANKNEIPFIRLGVSPQSPLRFRRSELDAWIAEQNTTAEEPAA